MQTLETWKQAGFRTTFWPHRLPRSEAVARMCVVRDLVSNGLTAGLAFGVAEDVANTVLLYALQSSSNLITFREKQGERFRKAQRDHGPADAYLSAFLGEAVGRFAKVDGAGRARFSDMAFDDDHVDQVVIDLESLAARMADRSGPLASMTVFPDHFADGDDCC